MEVDLQTSPQLGYPVDSGDAKYVSGLSTILVATIQEAKDRISQIEYIFCSQLFPNFQSKSKCLQKIYYEARKAAEDDWKKKESDLLLQIEELQLEKQRALEENQSLKLEKAKFLNIKDPLLDNVHELQKELKQRAKEVDEGRELQQKLLKLLESKDSVIANNEKMLKEHEEKEILLLRKQRSWEFEAQELRQDLLQKTNEVNEALELQNKLLQIVESKASVILNNKEKPSKEQEEKNLLLGKQKNLEKKVSELELELLQKSKEVDEGMELQNKLLQLVKSRASLVANREKQLKEHEEKTNMLLAKIKCLENKVDELQEELKGKTEEAAKGKELQENLLKKTELQASKMVNKDMLLNDYEREKKLLTAKLESLEENVEGLGEELKKKIDDVEERRKLQEQLLQQIDLNGSDMLKNKQQLEEHEKEKKLLLYKLKGLEEKVDELQVDLRGKGGELAEGRELHETLLQQIEVKASDLLFEKKKRRDIVAAYKRLKSQYNFLCTKFGLTTENMSPQHKIEDESDSLSHHQNPLTSPDLGNKNPDTSAVACETNKLKNEISFQANLGDEKGVGLIQTSSSHSPYSSSSPVAPKCPTNVKSGSLAGTKRAASYWRDTRSRQCQGGPDPHDDFLDTPLENIRGNLNKAIKEEVHDLPVPVLKDMNFDNSDDETQDLNADPSAQKQQMPVPRPVTRGFKYVEPVRKKAERENLKGIECKQCKKFYDAILPDGGCNDADGKKQNFRCEHHDGVSRHRYRYVPPMTPEGFWNIGFDSEM